MSEYWVSKKRYFCKYCDVYIADDAPSRQHHENGLRHKGNVERFVRGLYKAGEKRKKDADEEKREMRRIEQVRPLSFPCPFLSDSLAAKAASAAFAQDVGAGRAQYAATTSSSAVASSSSQQPRKSGGMSDYSTPESLGYTDPDIERAQAELERRRTQGIAGDWQVIESVPTDPPPGTGEGSAQHGDGVEHAEGDQEQSKKRAVPDPADEDEGRWKLRKKTTTVGLGEIYDPGIIAIKVKTKPEIEQEETASQSSCGTSAAGDAKVSAVPKWAPVKWKKAGEPADDASGAASSAPAGGAAPTEGAPEHPPEPSNVADNPASVKEEPLPVKLEEAITPPGETASSGGSLFRKRKAPVGRGTSSQGRKF
jgi:WW domain-binding protein 4